MTNRTRSLLGVIDEPTPLGMIVDRSSFDEEDRQDEISLDTSEVLERRRRKGDGKVRRKLKWKPAAFAKTKKIQSDVSVLTERSSKTTKSIGSFHTFHSTSTPVLSNYTKKKPVPLCRPYYRDSTLDGVSTIDNEGHYIHAKNQASTPETVATMPRSHTLPTQQSTATDDDYLTDDSMPVDPDVSTRFKKRRPPRAFVRSHSTQSSPGNSPPTTPSEPFSYKSPHSIASIAETEAEMDASFVLPEDFDQEVRRVPSFHKPPPSSISVQGLSPIKPSRTVSPFATPQKSLPDRRPPMVPLRMTPVQTRVMQWEKMMSQSAAKQPDMPLTSLAHRSYHRPKVSTTQEEKSFEEKSPREISFDRPGSEEKTDPPEKAEPPDSPERRPGNVVTRGSRVVPLSESTSPTSTGSNARKEMGPVDVDEGSFLEAELHLKAIHQMAAEHLAHGEFEEALEVFEEILRGQRERYGPGHYRIGTALHNIGIVHLKSGNYEEAAKICLEAVKLRKEALVPNHPDVAVSLAQLGVAYLECKQYRDALIAFREALKIRRAFLGHKHPKVGKILNNVGCALYELNELDVALLAFEEALEIQRESLRGPHGGENVEEKTNSNQILLSIAGTLCNIGSIKVRWCNFDEARVALEEALLIQQSVLGDNHPTVLSTIESIEHVGKSPDATCDTTISDFFSSWASTGDQSTAGTEVKSDTMQKLVSAMSSFTWNKSRRLYNTIEDLLPNARQCGIMNDVDDDASMPLSEGSSTLSFQVARENGYEF